MGSLKRLDNWPEALAEQVALAASCAYVLGEHDCLRFSCACIEAVTGENFWPQFAGYKNKVGAYRTIQSIAPTLKEAVSKVLGTEPQGVLFARRGDLMLFMDASGEHLGVCIGTRVAVLAPEKLHYLPLDHSGLLCSWRIG